MFFSYLISLSWKLSFIDISLGLFWLSKILESFNNGEDKVTDPNIKQDLVTLVEDLNYGYE